MCVYYRALFRKSTGSHWISTQRASNVDDPSLGVIVWHSSDTDYPTLTKHNVIDWRKKDESLESSSFAWTTFILAWRKNNTKR